VLARVRQLFSSLLIYGMGDVATSLISLLLLPIFVRYLSVEDYGIIAMLLAVEAATKVVFRWGVDTAFMRLYYDCTDQAARQRLASTIFLFLLVVNGALLLGAVLASGWLSTHLVDSPKYAGLITLTLVNIFFANFFFIPYHVIRIQQKPRLFIALTFTRSIGTVVARVVLVMWAGMGVTGIVVADVIVTVLMTLVLGRWFAGLLRPVFSRDVLREALGFGLPRVPHSVAQQVISVSDRYFLKRVGDLADVGLYSIGASFGMALKLFLSAFEFAWTPFFLSAMREPDSEKIYRTVSTYIAAVLILLTAGACVVAPPLVRWFTTPEFYGAATIAPWISLGVMFQGLYLIGSIGLVITKRTKSYPVATGIAAVVSVGMNLLLIPRFGMLGAAWANVLAYATLTIVTGVLSWRVYPIAYEWGRLVRLAVAGLAAYTTGHFATQADAWPPISILVGGSVVVATYPVVLLASGFMHRGELKVLSDVIARARRYRAS